MNRYSYKGPVMEFEQCVSNNWEGTTYATSEKKARSNLAYQYIMWKSWNSLQNVQM